MNRMKNLLVSSLLIIVLLIPASVNAQGGYRFLAENPAYQNNALGNSMPENLSFLGYLWQPWLGSGSGRYIKYYNGATSAVPVANAIALLGSLVSGANKTHIGFTSYSDESTANLRFYNEGGSHSCGSAPACFIPISYFPVTSDWSNMWYRGDVILDPTLPWANGSVKQAALAHELLHVIGLDHPVPSTWPNCTSATSIMIGAYYGSDGKLYMCNDVLVPSSSDLTNVRKLWGYIIDNAQFYTPQAITEDGSGITLEYTDHVFAEYYGEIVWYWSNSAQNDPWTQFNASPLDYQWSTVYGDGTHDTFFSYVFKEKVNPSNFGIHNKWITACVRPWYATNQYGKVTCSGQAQYWN